MTAADHSPVLPELHADCSRCVALCCVALAFSASAEFAFDKPAGSPCPNLAGNRCAVHSRLRPAGFAGCAAYDCFGAGQQTTQRVFAGRSWRESPELARQMFAVFRVVRPLHELLTYLQVAVSLAAARPVRPALREAIDEVAALTAAPPAVLLALDVDRLRDRVNPLLLAASELARRTPSGRLGRDLRGAALAGADLRATDLRRANLRGAVLVGTNLSGSDLRLADVTGADTRGARLDGADLAAALFLTQPQLDVASGDARTALPPGMRRPAHWKE